MTLFTEELGAETPTGQGRPDLATLAGKSEELAAVASAGALDEAQVAELEELIDSMHNLVDAWRYGRAG
jgi:hypothetical protein